MDTFLLAEKLGFDTIWTGDHLAFGPDEKLLDTWMTMTHVMMNTKKVKMGTAATDPHRRHPAVLAQMGMTMDVLTNGRFILGLGAGEAMNLDPYGISWDRPLARMEEAIAVIKKLWTEEVVDFQGDFFRLKSAYLGPKPIQKPYPPIWIGGQSKKTLELIGRVGDGWIPGGSTPKIYSNGVQTIKRSAKESGRDPDQIVPAVLMPTAVSKDRDEARKYVEMTAKIVSLHSPKVLKEMGFEPPSYEYTYGKFTYSREGIERMNEEAKKIPFDVVKERVVFGTPDDCIATIEKYVKSGARHIIVRPQSSDPKIRADFLRAYGTKIIPYFQEKRS